MHPNPINSSSNYLRSKDYGTKPSAHHSITQTIRFKHIPKGSLTHTTTHKHIRYCSESQIPDTAIRTLVPLIERDIEHYYGRSSPPSSRFWKSSQLRIPIEFLSGKARSHCSHWRRRHHRRRQWQACEDLNSRLDDLNPMSTWLLHSLLFFVIAFVGWSRENRNMSPDAKKSPPPQPALRRRRLILSHRIPIGGNSINLERCIISEFFRKKHAGNWKTYLEFPLGGVLGRYSFQLRHRGSQSGSMRTNQERSNLIHVSSSFQTWRECVIRVILFCEPLNSRLRQKRPECAVGTGGNTTPRAGICVGRRTERLFQLS